MLLESPSGPGERSARDRACSTRLRKFAGPQGSELAISCRPDARASNTVEQAEAVYRALAALLASERASFREVARETLFVRDIRRDLPTLLGARARILADLGQSACAPPPAFVQQAPVAEAASFELSVWAMVPRERDEWSVQDFSAAPVCTCEGCARSGARLVRLGDQWSLHATNVYGAGRDAFEQAWDMFCAAERLLEQSGMAFRDVVRTWIHVGDIARDYDALNAARRAFFRDRGIDPRPASTGVQGLPLPDAHDFSMSLHAVRSPTRSIDVAVMSTPSLAEAWNYGADFSRGLRVADANKVALYVSGTASIDDEGRTVHVGDFRAQVDRMARNIASLLARQGASFEDVVSGVAYLVNPSDAPVLLAMCSDRGFHGFPCALVEAPLCRPELLCEAEVVAMLPRSSP